MPAAPCIPGTESPARIELSEEEMVAIFMNMIAFDGDWDAHLAFLEKVDASERWKYSQIPLVQALREKDRLHGIQSAIS